jgi:hypothetical protein
MSAHWPPPGTGSRILQGKRSRVLGNSLELDLSSEEAAVVLDKLPKRLQPKAKSAPHEIMKAPNRGAAEKEIEAFREEYGAKSDGGCLTHTGPGEPAHILRLPGRALVSHPEKQIESAVPTVRLRQRVTKRAGVEFSVRVCEAHRPHGSMAGSRGLRTRCLAGY